MSELIDNLRRLGFSEYEAKAYVALIQRSHLTGYELARSSGVPRADIYAVLNKLEERGTVIRLDVEAGTRYSAVPPGEVIGRLQTRFQETAWAAFHWLDELVQPPERDPVWNARGYAVLIEYARTLVDAAQESLLIALSPTEAEEIATTLAAAERRGVGVTTLCLAACPSECGWCHGRIERECAGPKQEERWLVVVSDRRELLAGTIDGNQDAVAIRTRQSLMVTLAATYILHSIALSTVVKDIGQSLQQLVRPETFALLAGLNIGGLEQPTRQSHRKRKQAA